MEIKATLKKPYTEIERFNFIIRQNHELAYRLKETDLGLEAWGYTDKEKEEQKKALEIDEIKELLNENDLKSIRAIRENDTEYIAKYEQEAKRLRQRLKELAGE